MEGKVKLNLKSCRHCGRTFVPESLAKHEPACKNVQKKRKPFDPAKQRVTEDLSLKQIKAAQKKPDKKPKSHWKEQHEQFISNIRNARGAQIAMERGEPLPPPPPAAINPDYVQCPHCDRRFNEKAAERHISFCKEQKTRLTPKRQPSEQEKARAAAKGFQAPRPIGRGQAGTVESSPSGGRGYGSGGGYSSGAGRGGSVGGGRGATRTPPGASNQRSEMDRGPAGGGYSTGSGGYSTRGRAPPGAATGAAKGRPSPATQGRYAR